MSKKKYLSILLARCFRVLTTDKLTIKFQYFHQRKKWPNFRDPKDLSEIILSERLSPKFDKYALYADKLKVREFVRSKGLEKILLKHYGCWKRPEDIDFDRLPKKFILKANNGCGNHVICKNKFSFNKQEAIETLKISMEKGLHHPERHYRAIVPMVFCEQFLDTGTDEWPTDYKIQCVGGRPDHFFVASERSSGDTKYCTFDLNWSYIPYTKHSFEPVKMPLKPQCLEEMIAYASILCSNFDYVRVDFYEFKGQVYFSELTFTPWGGFMYSYTNDAIRLLGEKIGNRI